MVAEDREGAEAGCVGADRRPQQVLRPEAHRSSSISERQRGPSTSSLARSSYVRRPAAPRRLPSSGSACDTSHRVRERDRVARRNEQGVLAVGEQLAGGRGVGGDERRPTRERLVRLVRDHAVSLVRGAEDPQRAARSPVLARQVLVGDPAGPLDVRRMLVHHAVELAAADDAHRHVWSEPCRLEDRLQAVERDQLADEEDAKRLVGPPTCVEEPVLRADEADADALAGDPPQLGEEVRVRLGVRDDEVGLPQRTAVDGRQHGRPEPSLAKPPAVGHERLVQRDERVEDQRPAAGDATGPRHVEVPGIADDHGVERNPWRESQP